MTEGAAAAAVIKRGVARVVGEAGDDHHQPAVEVEAASAADLRVAEGVEGAALMAAPTAAAAGQTASTQRMEGQLARNPAAAAAAVVV